MKHRIICITMCGKNNDMRFKEMVFMPKNEEHREAIIDKLLDMRYYGLMPDEERRYMYTNNKGQIYYGDTLKVGVDLYSLDDLYGKQEEPIYIGEDLVRFEEDGISFGDISVDKETIREIWEILE